MIDSVILVRVRSLFTGRKFLTPDIKESKFAPRAPEVMRSVSRFEREENPRKRSEEGCWGVAAAAVVIIVIRVISRTLFTNATALMSVHPACMSASSKRLSSALERSVSVLKNQIKKSRNLSNGFVPPSGLHNISRICDLFCFVMFSSSWKKLSNCRSLIPFRRAVAMFICMSRSALRSRSSGRSVMAALRC